MRISDVTIDDVAAGKNWRLLEVDDPSPDMVDWEIEDCSSFHATDSVVYSALAARKTGRVVPLLLIREVGTHEWWGDTCIYVDGAWRELGQTNDWQPGDEEFVASPLDEDPSFMGEYSHDVQRAGFRKWRNRMLIAAVPAGDG